MTTQETRNIVIIGASFGGISIAHYFLKHIAPALKASPTAGSASYKLILIDPSTHFWWRPSAPRALVEASLMPHSKTFVPIADCFKGYPASAVSLRQGRATAVDTAAGTVTFQPTTDAVHSKSTSTSDSTPTETIPYHALVLATGTTTGSPLTSLIGPHTGTISALDAMNTRLRAAKSIVVGGGGPVAVETAGEIGEALNGVAGWGSERPGKPKASVLLVTSGAKLLPKLRPALSDKAETYLNRVGADVRYNTRVVSAEPAADGQQTTVTLDNGETLLADVYIPAIGATPNTSFLPDDLLDSRGYVNCNSATLRVEGAGSAARVYCIGDCGNYCRGGILDLYDALPVLGANMAVDLGASGFKARNYVDKKAETQVVPVGRGKGVGAFNGWKLPSMAVNMIKGKDYMTSRMPEITTGSKWASK